MTDWLSSAVQLGIGGLSVAGLVYVTIRFLDKMETADKRHVEAQESMSKRYLEAQQTNARRHEEAMTERENSLRQVESHVRDTITSSLTQNTIALADTAKVLGRVTRQLDGSK